VTHRYYYVCVTNSVQGLDSGHNVQKGHFEGVLSGLDWSRNDRILPMAGSKKQRLSAEETRQRLIDVGVELLCTHGMSVGLDAVTLEQAVRTADVSRSSAYAAWSTDDDYSPQELFQRTVLRQAVLDRNATIGELQEVVANVVATHADTMTPTELLREMIRVGGGTNIRSVANSTSWQLVNALRSILHSTSDGERDEDFASWMDEAEEDLRLDTIENVYKPMVELIGLTPRPEYGELAYQYGEISAAALSEGLATRYSLSASEYLDGLTHPKDPDREWSLYALMFEQMVRAYFLPPGGGEWE